ncbi:hypothetical protein DEX24_15945 [Kurthia sibirica]|uniref:Uncharacterized protein n=1 Tax=Kurthia sibirica TaxID=202750 RepID=A0A2U3AGB9_9BACL|nr:hypothetical protein DEX24_15945 [Kurthia sibirica]
MLRQIIQQACQQYTSTYSELVEPVNNLLIALDADISEKTASSVIANLQNYFNGQCSIQACHLEESNHFLEDGIRTLKNGDTANGAVQLFGAGLNFASYLMKSDGLKNTDPYLELNERFIKLFQELQ